MAENLNDWSTTAATNATADAGINWAEGQTPGSVNSSARSMMAALAKFLGDNNGTKTTASAVANAYTLTGNTAHTALTNGIRLRVKANSTNTGASTFNLNALGAKKIFTRGQAGLADLVANQFGNNGHWDLEYDTAADAGNGAWILINSPFDQFAGVTGSILAYAGSGAPTGWLLCDGSVVSRTTQAALFAVCSTTYNTGGEAGTDFRLPNLTGRAVFGKEAVATRITTAGSGIDGATLGATGGAQTVALITANLASHTHTFSATTGIESVGHTHSFSATTSTESADHTHTYSGTTSTESADHTHSGTTGAQSADHTHTGSGTTTTESADHTHTGTTGTESADHIHTATVTDGGHTHDVKYTLNNVFAATGTTNAVIGLGSGGSSTGGGAAVSSVTGITVANSGVSATHTHSFTSNGVSANHTHTYSFTTTGVSVGHNHAFTSGGVSVTHTHTYSGTTSGKSATHTHTVSGTSGAQSANHTHDVSGTSGASGSGTAHNNMVPCIMLSYIIKT